MTFLPYPCDLNFRYDGCQDFFLFLIKAPLKRYRGKLVGKNYIKDSEWAVWKKYISY